jgi:hypothetical protein
MTTAVDDLDESIVGNLVLLIGLPCRRRACSQPDQALDLEHRPVLEVWAVRLSGAVRQQGPLTGASSGAGLPAQTMPLGRQGRVIPLSTQ